MPAAIHSIDHPLPTEVTLQTSAAVAVQIAELETQVAEVLADRDAWRFLFQADGPHKTAARCRRGLERVARMTLTVWPPVALEHPNYLDVVARMGVSRETVRAFFKRHRLPLVRHLSGTR